MQRVAGRSSRRTLWGGRRLAARPRVTPARAVRRVCKVCCSRGHSPRAVYHRTVLGKDARLLTASALKHDCLQSLLHRCCMLHRREHNDPPLCPPDYKSDQAHPTYCRHAWCHRPNFDLFPGYNQLEHAVVFACLCERKC